MNIENHVRRRAFKYVLVESARRFFFLEMARTPQPTEGRDDKRRLFQPFSSLKKENVRMQPFPIGFVAENESTTRKVLHGSPTSK